LAAPNDKRGKKAGRRFISIWEGFVDDNGNFAFSGYDVNGSMARLRTADGISFTAAGQRKLAFYAGNAETLLCPSYPPPVWPASPAAERRSALPRQNAKPRGVKSPLPCF